MKKDDKKEFWIAIGSGVGIVIGTAIGVLTDNLGLWLGVGISIGCAFVLPFCRSNKGGCDGRKENLTLK
jgi:hypothetical protein